MNSKFVKMEDDTRKHFEELEGLDHQIEKVWKFHAGALAVFMAITIAAIGLPFAELSENKEFYLLIGTICLLTGAIAAFVCERVSKRILRRCMRDRHRLVSHLEKLGVPQSFIHAHKQGDSVRFQNGGLGASRAHLVRPRKAP